MNSWSFGIQRDIGKGLVIEAAYVGNNSHHANGTNFNQNGVNADTVWSPTGGTCNSVGYCTGSLNPTYENPVQTTAVLPINLLRTFPGFITESRYYHLYREWRLDLQFAAGAAQQTLRQVSQVLQQLDLAEDH